MRTLDHDPCRRCARRQFWRPTEWLLLILHAPAALECRRYMTLEVGKAREIILGEVVGLFVRSAAVDDRLHIDQNAMDAVGRMGGHSYTRTQDQFEIVTPTPQQWVDGKRRPEVA